MLYEVITLVEVQFQDLVLGELLFDAPGQEHLLELAQHGLLPAEEEVACHLLGNGTGTLVV